MARPGAALSLAAFTAIAVTLILAFHADETLELPLRDVALRSLPSRPAKSTVVVAIDERSLHQIGAWPWSRPVLAEIVDRIAAGGAGAVILDILLTDERPGDERLAQSLRRLPAVAVSVLDERGQWLVPAPAIRAAATSAHGNFELDHDGILRRFASTKQSRNQALTALSVEAATILTGAPVPIGRSIAPALRTRPRQIPLISAADVLHSTPNVRGKLVFIGPTALALGDRVLTPVSSDLLPDPGVTVHAAATESLVRGEEVREVAPLVAGCIAAIAVGLIVQTRHSRALRFTLGATIIVSMIAGGLLLLGGAGIAIPFVILLLAVLSAAAGVEATLMMSAVRQSRFAATKMERGLGLSPSGDPLDVGPRLEEIATLLAERRGQEAESKRMLAHELKTPLASMRNLSQLLGGFDLTAAERRRVAALLETEAGKLQSMVHVLLDLERLPLRDFDASSTVIDFGELIATRVEFLRASSDRPLIMSTEPDIVVRADTQLLERVVDNLVGNAFKYSPAGTPIVITARTNDDQAILEVEDRGPGIDAAERARIFHRFFRGSSAAGTQGLGLGLALVAEVARWHGGAVVVDDAAEGGARFRFTLPLAKTAARVGAM